MSIRPDTEDTREDAARVVASGGVIAFRTDTFYGLGANPLNAKAVQRIRALKGRDDGKPILLLIGEFAAFHRRHVADPPPYPAPSLTTSRANGVVRRTQAEQCISE